MDLYEVLGVPRDATHEQIKTAFRKHARRTHPDRHPHDLDAHARFKRMSEAFHILSDPVTRKRYDRDSRSPRSLQDLLMTTSGGKLLASVLPYASAQRRDGEDLVCVRGGDGDCVILSDPRDPEQTLEIPLPRLHRMCRVADVGAPGNAGGSRGDLFIIPQTQKEGK